MSDLPHDWLFQTLTRLEERMSAHQAENRQGFADLGNKLDGVRQRVTRIEAAAEAEEKQAVRRGAWAGVGAGAVVSGVIEAVRMWAQR